MEKNVRETLEDLRLQPEDAGLRALAVRIARTMDESAKLAEEAASIPHDRDTAQAVAPLRQRVEAHTVVAERGPKLRTVRDALGATPKARTTVGKTAPAGGPSRLAALRGGA